LLVAAGILVNFIVQSLRSPRAARAVRDAAAKELALRAEAQAKRLNDPTGAGEASP
jgi:hypothetical protein